MNRDHLAKPDWLKKPAVSFASTAGVRSRVSEHRLNTVCKSARCPNMGECFSQGVATFMILGDLCSRQCGFCAVRAGHGDMAVDKDEPARVAEAVAEMKLKHVVITSVTRDDLLDGGAAHFAQTVKALRQTSAEPTIEVLTPDFNGLSESIDLVADAGPDVYNHNVETVPRLYPKVRPAAVYRRSLDLLERVKQRHPDMLAKSGLMLGLGETKEEVTEVLHDLRGTGCDIVTIGQYLRPTLSNLPVEEYVNPQVFDELAETGQKMGFRALFSAPFVRSSYHAAEVLARSSIPSDRSNTPD